MNHPQPAFVEPPRTHPFSRSYTAISVTISRIECTVCPVFSITNENEPPPKFIGYPSLTSTSFLRPISSSHLAQLFPQADAVNYSVIEWPSIEGRIPSHFSCLTG